MKKITLHSAAPELFVFDWSGVVSDDRMPVYQSNMRLFYDYGIENITFEQWLERTTLTPVEILRNHGCTADAEGIWADYKRVFREYSPVFPPKAYPDAAESLSLLKQNGKRLAVLSSHPSESLEAEAQRYGILQMFELVEGNAKDKAEGIEAICARLAVPRQKAVYLGDTIYDVQAAKKAGVWSAAMCSGYHKRARLEAESPDFAFESLSEMAASR